MNYEVLFSVIVPTFNRADEINELLESLLTQTIDFSEFEIIVVDDGSDDNTEDIIKGFINKSGLKINFLKQNHKGPGEARNLGMENAKGKYLLFIDSDCIADKSWLSAYKKALESSEPAGFGGPDAVLPDFSPVQKAIDYSMTSFITTGGIRGHSGKKISKYYPRSFNMGVRNDIYKKIGGMNKLRHGQDIEFSHRIIKTGEPVIKVADAVVYHKRRISVKKFFKQVFNWGVARINLYKIDNKMLEPVHFFPAAGTLMSALIIIFTIFLPGIFLPILVAGIIVLIIMSIHAGVKYKDMRVCKYIPLIVPTQIIGYGTGFIYAFIRRVIFNRKETTGFVKKYYN